MFARTASLVLFCGSVFAGPQPELSSPQVIRIADRAARSALHRELEGFTRRAINYSAYHHQQWSVVYKNMKETSPSYLVVLVSDGTRKTKVIFEDASFLRGAFDE